MISALEVFWKAMALHLWHTSLFLGVLFLLEIGLRKAPAHLTHFLWLTGLARILIPVPLLKRALLDLPDRWIPASSVPGSIGIPEIAVLERIADPANAFSGIEIGSSPIHTAVLVVMSALWASVSLILMLRIIRDLRDSSAGSGSTLTSLDGPAARRLHRICIGCGIGPGHVNITDEKLMPGVTGIIGPRIVVPRVMLDLLEDGELAAILLHEENHRKRRDPLRSLIARLGQAIFHFYPLVYPVMRRLHATAEYACDEVPLRTGISPAEYARAFTRTLRIGLAPGCMHSTAAVGDRSLLRKRFNRLFETRRNKMTVGNRVIVTLTVLALAGGFLFPAPSSAGGDEVPPEVIKTVHPDYPKEALKAGVYCRLVLKVLVDEKGDVSKAEVVDLATFSTEDEKAEAAKDEKLYKVFEKSVLEAVYRWKFNPATRDGKAVEAEVRVPVDFKLD
jgi:beta-lactamase regulating signal transducer with metallopeptidase domain